MINYFIFYFFWYGLVFGDTRISYVSKKRRGYLLRGAKGAMYKNQQICGNQMYEKQFRQHRTGSKAFKDIIL
jgi:hypothetical protein